MEEVIGEASCSDWTVWGLVRVQITRGKPVLPKSRNEARWVDSLFGN